MAIPDFQTLMLPILKQCGDGQEHGHAEVVTSLALQFRLSEDETRELLPSGKQATFDNRVGWARSYLKKAGLVENTGRARFKVTTRGTEVLAHPPARINLKFLRQYTDSPDLQESLLPGNGHDENVKSQTPQELLELSYQNSRNDLARELLDRVKSSSPRFFERMVVDLLVTMGYGGSRKDAGQAVGRSGDDGIDGIIKEDKLGLDAIYIQAKRWEGPVGRPTVQAFAGSLEGHRARKGVMITTSSFSRDALEYVNRIEKKIVLVDGAALYQLMIDHSIGVAIVENYILKRMDQDYFDEE